MPMFSQEPPHLVVTRQNGPYHHQLPPYGKLGEPYVVTKHTIAHDPDDSISTSTYTQTQTQTNAFKSKWSLSQMKRLNHQLNKCFPFLYVVTHAACLILNSIIQIGLQIALMSTNGALWWVGAGIWTGVYFLITGLVTLMLVYNRSYCTYIAAYVLHVFGVLVCIGGYMVVNIIGISEYINPCSYYPNCFNADVKPISYIMFWLGVICLIMILLFIVLMPCWIMDCCNQWNKYRQDTKKQNESQSIEQIKQKIQEKKGPLTHSSLYVQNELMNPEYLAQNLKGNNQKMNLNF